MKQYPFRFAVAYAGLGAVAIASILVTLLLAFTSYTPVAHKSDLGPTTPPALIAQAEKAVAQIAQSNGVTVVSQKVLSTEYTDANTLVVRIRVTQPGGVSNVVEITLSRGLWTTADFKVKS